MPWDASLLAIMLPTYHLQYVRERRASSYHSFLLLVVVILFRSFAKPTRFLDKECSLSLDDDTRHYYEAAPRRGNSSLVDIKREKLGGDGWDP
jgi:hypothetical protein